MKPVYTTIWLAFLTAMVAVLLFFSFIDAGHINDLSRRAVCLEDWTQSHESEDWRNCNLPQKYRP